MKLFNRYIVVNVRERPAHSSLQNATLDELRNILVDSDTKKKALDILIQRAYSRGVLGQEPIEIK